MTIPHIDKPCPFCTLPSSRIVEENDHAISILAGYPVSPGHSLVIPKRHFTSFVEVTAVERSALFALLDEAKVLVEKMHHPAGYNIGINDSAAASGGSAWLAAARYEPVDESCTGCFAT